MLQISIPTVFQTVVLDTRKTNKNVLSLIAKRVYLCEQIKQIDGELLKCQKGGNGNEGSNSAVLQCVPDRGAVCIKRKKTSTVSVS